MVSLLDKYPFDGWNIKSLKYSILVLVQDRDTDSESVS